MSKQQVAKIQRPNKSMADKLRDQLETNNVGFTGTKKGVDGVDHINIGRGCKTDLGGWLNQYREDRFKHNVLGYFLSIDRIRLYLAMVEKDDVIRTCPGNTLSRIIKVARRKKVTNAVAILIDAHWQRLQQNDKMLLAMKNSTLPFTSYDINPEFPLVREQHPLVMPMLLGLEELRKAIQENREPNFTYFLEDEQRTIRECIIEALGLTEAEVADMLSVQQKAAPQKEHTHKPKQKKNHENKKRNHADTEVEGNKVTPTETIHYPEDYGNAKENEAQKTVDDEDIVDTYASDNDDSASETRVSEAQAVE
jgi:hypothetical protein